jgi:hypothetical protein
MKNAIRYAALAMTMISSTALLSGFLSLLGAYSFAQHRFVSALINPFDTLFAAVACLGFGRSYQLLGRGELDATSKTQTEIELVHVWFLCSWFFFIFMVQQMNLPHRSVSSRALVASVVAALIFVADGFFIRKRFFRLSTESLPGDVSKALRVWRGAHLISFCCAMSLAILGFVLKFFGSSWLVPGIFFGLSLGFLLLWRPRQLAASDVQPV